MDDEEELPRKHGGGPLKRTGQQADEWDECVAPFLGPALSAQTSYQKGSSSEVPGAQNPTTKWFKAPTGHSDRW